MKQRAEVRRFVPARAVAGGALLVLLAQLLGVQRADAGLIATVGLEHVVACSSHIVLVRYEDATQPPRVVRWLRGSGPTETLEVHDVSGYLSWALQRNELRIFDSRRSRSDPPVRPDGRVFLFLESVDGRFYQTGHRRYGPGFDAPASVRCVADGGEVYGLKQVMNPGKPMWTRIELLKADAFEAHLRRMIARFPYTPPAAPRRELSVAARESFFEALGDAIDWYQGRGHVTHAGWRGRDPTAQVIADASARLDAWMESASPEDRVVGLDALMLLARKVQGGGPTAAPALAAAGRWIGHVPRDAAMSWLRNELRHGGYYAPRVALCRLGRTLGEEAYRTLVLELEVWVARTEDSEGTACWWDLVELGHRDLAEAAAARREQGPPGESR